MTDSAISSSRELGRFCRFLGVGVVGTLLDFSVLTILKLLGLQTLLANSASFTSSRGKESGGTGLGLSIAKSIIEAHGGTIEVESALGEGTSILISLPI